ncbi:MAG TPA: hypothetical protein VGU23_06035 [Acidobacteriaceae bacterium]|nr:hypothetical protein [Acidobacteriaceae bacterium]
MAINEKDMQSILKRLDLIASLLCLLVDMKNVPTITDQIKVLSERGLAPAEVGRVVGREANYISASLKSKKKVKKDVN